MQKAKFCKSVILLVLVAGIRAVAADALFAVTEDSDAIHVTTSALNATVRKKGYVSGVAEGSFLDVKTGFRDPGYGLDIMDWILEPGSDEAYRAMLPDELVYRFGNPFHGNTPKRSVEGPQICTRAGQLKPTIIRGKDFVAITQAWTFTLAAPGKQPGSTWRQTLVFPAGVRYFFASDRITSVNSVDAPFFRIDMPGHIRHTHGDTFSEVYLSYRGLIPASEFSENFAPDAKFEYRRDRDKIPSRLIRAYHLRDPQSKADGPWLAGMTLNPSDVYEAWCHQRGYVCFIEEIGGRPIKAGDSFGAAYIVGYFNSIEQMEKTYDHFSGHSSLDVSQSGWTVK